MADPMTRERVVHTLIFFGRSLAEKEQLDVLREIRDADRYAHDRLIVAAVKASAELLADLTKAGAI